MHYSKQDFALHQAKLKLLSQVFNEIAGYLSPDPGQFSYMKASIPTQEQVEDAVKAFTAAAEEIVRLREDALRLGLAITAER